jgi:hypothetical protein
VQVQEDFKESIVKMKEQLEELRSSTGSIASIASASNMKPVGMGLGKGKGKGRMVMSGKSVTKSIQLDEDPEQANVAKEWIEKIGDIFYSEELSFLNITLSRTMATNISSFYQYHYSLFNKKRLFLMTHTTVPPPPTIGNSAITNTSYLLSDISYIYTDNSNKAMPRNRSQTTSMLSNLVGMSNIPKDDKVILKAPSQDYTVAAKLPGKISTTSSVSNSSKSGNTSGSKANSISVPTDETDALFNEIFDIVWHLDTLLAKNQNEPSNTSCRRNLSPCLVSHIARSEIIRRIDIASEKKMESSVKPTASQINIGRKRLERDGFGVASTAEYGLLNLYDPYRESWTSSSQSIDKGISIASGIAHSRTCKELQRKGISVDSFLLTNPLNSATGNDVVLVPSWLATGGVVVDTPFQISFQPRNSTAAGITKLKKSKLVPGKKVTTAPTSNGAPPTASTVNSSASSSSNTAPASIVAVSETISTVSNGLVSTTSNGSQRFMKRGWKTPMGRFVNPHDGYHPQLSRHYNYVSDSATRKRRYKEPNVNTKGNILL